MWPRYAGWPKRLLDVAFAATLLVLLLPVAAIISLAIRLNMGRPVLFQQDRTGRDEVSFTLVKFRTMRQQSGSQYGQHHDRDRLTGLGVFLRRTSLDEIPELWNILIGDMSFVGPRPFPLRYTPYFRQPERARFRLRPGLTGLAQVSGRNNLAWDTRFALDQLYVETCCLRVDASILAQTLRVTFSRAGIEVDPSSAMADLDAERAAAAGDLPPEQASPQ
jgi:lipopolysaccharide/colanic/teichoic acid biosynthesis glycosyltransferase